MFPIVRIAVRLKERASPQVPTEDPLFLELLDERGRAFRPMPNRGKTLHPGQERS